MLSSNLFKYFHKESTQQNEQQSQALLTTYGWIATFLLLHPILGDVIPIVAGMKKYDFNTFAIAISTEKAVKVLAIVYISSFLATTFLHSPFSRDDPLLCSFGNLD